MQKILFSKKTDYWNTPKKIYQHYIEQGYFDPCPENPTFNGLEIDWKEKNFVNPPFSQLKAWAMKAVEEYKKGHLVVFHAPSRTDTKWFHYILDNCKHWEIRFYKGRLHYNDSKNPAPFPTLEITLIPEVE